MNKTTLVILSLCFSFSLFADAAKQAELEARVKRLEAQVQMLLKQNNAQASGSNSGLRTVDYNNNKIAERAAAATKPSISPSKLQELKDNINKYRKNKAEAEKYLEELMQEE